MLAMCKQTATEKVALTRACLSSPAGLQNLRSWSNSALAPLAAELEDLVELFAERSDDKCQSRTSSTPYNECDPYDSESSATLTPVVHAPGPAHFRTPNRGVALRVRAALILVAVLGFMHTGRRWASERVRQPVQRQPLGAIEEADAAASADAANRGYLKAGSLYQNDYMTLWNENGGPISVTLEVGEGDSFELKVNHINSINKGNEGWFVVRGNFQTEAHEDKESTRRILPEASADDKQVPLYITPAPLLTGQAFMYDPKVLDRACSIAYKCMERVGMLGVVQLEVNVKEDTVLVTPRSSIVKLFWDEAVVLRLTTKENMWAPKSLEEGSAPSAPSSETPAER